MSAPPLDWVKKVEETLLALEEKPQFGEVPSLDVHKFQEALRKIFSLPSLKVNYQLKGWTPFGAIYDGIGAKRSFLTLAMPPSADNLFFVTTEEDLKILMAELLGGEETAAHFYDKGVAYGFFEYFAVEILSLLENLHFAAPFSFRIAETKTPKEQTYFACDVSLEVDKRTFWGRILISDSLRKSLKQTFIKREEEPLSQEMKEKIMVDVALEVGMSGLSLEDFQKIKPGDFVLLEHCSYDPEKKKGSTVLTIDQKPVLRARFKPEGIKITHFSLYEEISGVSAMNDKEFEEDEDLYEEDEEDLFKDLPDEEAEIKAQTLAKEEQAPKINPDDLPVNLTVEVTRLRMSAAELMRLLPGNLLELDVTPEQGVDLVVNGRKVGRGELVRLGEVLGVRILSL